MDMAKYFLNVNEQKEKLRLEELERQRAQENVDKSESLIDKKEEEQEELTEEEKIDLLISEYSKRIFEAANNFDIDTNQGAEGHNSKFDQMIRSKLLMKGLETDSIYYVEGQYDKVSSFT